MIQIFGYASDRLDPAAGIQRPANGALTVLDVPGAALWAAGLVGCAIAAFDRRLRTVALPAAALMVVTYLRVRSASYEYPHHYYPALPGACAGIAVDIAALWSLATARRFALAALVLAAPLWAYVLQPQLDALQQTPAQRWGPIPYPLQYPVAAFVSKRTCPGDTLIMADSAAYVNWLADRRAPSRFFDVYGAIDSAAYRSERIADLQRSPPAAIGRIGGPALDADLAALIARDAYVLAYDVNGAQVWLRPDVTDSRRC